MLPDDREWLQLATQQQITTGKFDWVPSVREFEVELKAGYWEAIEALKLVHPLRLLRELAQELQSLQRCPSST